jgi:outer membrane protein
MLVAQTPLSLADAVRSALDYSYAVQSARHDSAAAAWRSAVARADRFPVLSLEAKSFYVDEVPVMTLPFGNREMGSKENYQTDLTLSAPLYTGGRLSHRIKIEEEAARAQRAGLTAVKMQVAYRTRQAYLSLMAAQAKAKAAAASLERVQIIQTDVEHLHANGLADTLDLLEAQLAVESARQMVSQSRAETANASSSLMQLIGHAAGDSMVPAETLVDPDPAPYAGAIDSGRVNRAELEQLDHLARAAEYRVTVERGAYAPSVSGFAGYSYGMPNRDWFGKSWNDYATVGLALKWELNLGGKTGKNIQAARQAAMSARTARRELQDKILLQADLARTNVTYAYDSYLNSRQQHAIAVRQYELARLRQQEGEISINRLLERETDLTGAEQRFQASLAAYHLAVNDYLYAVGSPKLFGGL